MGGGGHRGILHKGNVSLSEPVRGTAICGSVMFPFPSMGEGETEEVSSLRDVTDGPAACGDPQPSKLAGNAASPSRRGRIALIFPFYLR